MELPKKQEQVQKYILNRINAGMRQGDILPSITDLARELHRSRMTIARALDSLESLELIYRVPGKGTFVGRRENAYKKPIPYFRPAAPVPGKRGVITFLSPFLHDDEFMFDFTRGVEDGIDRGKYELVKRHVWILKMREDQVLREAALASSGMIVLSSHPPEMQQVIRELARKNYPLVLLDRWPAELLCNSVSADNEDAVFMGMEHLYELGHRRILFAVDRDNNSSTRSRIAAYNRFMLRKALPPEVVIGFDSLLSMFAKRNAAERPTAIFAVWDGYASAICKALMKRGIKIPRDLSVIGFDNDPISRDPSLPLTTLAQQKYKIGLKAADLLDKIIRGENEPNTFLRYFVPCELIKRKSTKAVTRAKLEK